MSCQAALNVCIVININCIENITSDRTSLNCYQLQIYVEYPDPYRYTLAMIQRGGIP